jgi:hypothetical protein
MRAFAAEVAAAAGTAGAAAGGGGRGLLDREGFRRALRSRLIRRNVSVTDQEARSLSLSPPPLTCP